MTTLEHWQQQPSSHLGGQQASTTRTPTQSNANVEVEEGLRQNFSRLKLSSPLSLPFNIVSKASQPAEPCPAHAVAPDSGYGAAPSSSPSLQDEPLGLVLPGTKLRYFDKPIPERLRVRFFDIKVLYTRPLLDSISRRRKDPGDISMKLKHLGFSAQSIELHIVIQCDKRVAKRVKKFFAQEHVEEELLPDFRVLVLESTLLRLANDDVVEVLSDSLPEKTMCGMPITLSRSGKSVTCTFGGVVMVETSQKRLYGLIAGHPLKSLLGTSSGKQPMSEAYRSSSSEEEEYYDSYSDDTSEGTSVASSKSVHSDIEGKDDDHPRTKLNIGAVVHDTFGFPVESNYDWALVDINHEYLLPNLMIPDPELQGSDFEDPEAEINAYYPSLLDSALTKQVLVLKQGKSLKAELSFNTASLMISPGSRFVDVFDIIMKDGSSLCPGDSGLWVVDAKTSRLYGHVVSVDAFGEAQAMPIYSTLKSIRRRLKAKRVSLPYSWEIDQLMTTLGNPSLSVLSESPGPESEPAPRSTVRSEQDAPDARLASTKRFGSIITRAGNTYVENSDILDVIDVGDALAYDLYLTSLVLQARHSNTTFPDLCTELRKLHRSLNHLRTEARDQESTLHSHPAAEEIPDILEFCLQALRRGRARLRLYESDNLPVESRKRDNSLMDPQEAFGIASCRSGIESFLDRIQLGHAHNTSHELLDLENIKNKVDKITSRLLEDQNIQSYWGDRDSLWEQSQAHLLNEGLSPGVLQKNRRIIRAYVRILLNTASIAESPSFNGRDPFKQSEIEGFDKSHDPNYRKSPSDDSGELIDWMEIVSTQSLIALDDAERLMARRLLSPRDATQLMNSPPPYIQRQSQDPGHTSIPNSFSPRERDFKTYPDSEWTMIARELVSVEVLERACVRYEARPDYIAILGRLSREQAEEFVRESKIARAARSTRAETGDGLGDEETEVCHNRTSTRSDEDSTNTHSTTKASGASNPEDPVDAFYISPNSHGISESKQRWKDLRKKTVFGGVQQKLQLRQGGVEETHKKPVAVGGAAASLLSVLAEASESL